MRYLLLFISLVSGGSNIALADPAPLVKKNESSTISRAQKTFYEVAGHLCGSIFEGRSSYLADPNHHFANQPLNVSIVSCNYKEIRIAVGVGDDYSRNWILKKRSKGLVLQHENRQPDGSPSKTSLYGGWATASGTATKQYFRADKRTAKILPKAAGDIWMLEFDIKKGELTYALNRQGKRHVEVVLKQRKKHYQRKRTLF